MTKLFAVVVATVSEYYAYKKEHPEHDVAQLAWFKEQAQKGNLVGCGPFVPPDGTGLWILKAESLEEAIAIVQTSPRFLDGMLAKEARVVEWNVHIGGALFLNGT